MKKGILDEINRKSGMKVPDGYFDSLHDRVMQNLPEKEIIVEQPAPISFWTMAKPWVYMAAMFAGIWLMVQVFVAPIVNEEREMTAALEQEEDMEEYMLYSMDEYTIFETLYAESE